MLAFVAEGQRRPVNTDLEPIFTQYGQENLFFHHEDGRKILVAGSRRQHYLVSLAQIRQTIWHDISPAVCALPFEILLYLSTYALSKK